MSLARQDWACSPAPKNLQTRAKRLGAGFGRWLVAGKTRAPLALRLRAQVTAASRFNTTTPTGKKKETKPNPAPKNEGSHFQYPIHQ